ncbi:hypothetical protein GUY60_34245 [Streptomyces sp. YC537]|uniref:Clp R domain-containing protein n=1 Tax=Streptomyces boluensis TaxID=1775135 RepID=A0A964XR31_9ACTN|nr:hypothetical protein [Streptomyces boluensis]
MADDLVEDYVDHCRMHGASWTDIGAALGVSRQAAQQRFHAPHKRYNPDEHFTQELRLAMGHVKRAAVQHRNNYIGTEHLLFGLTAEDNSATRLLERAGADRARLHGAVAARLSLGASQAAERIAWTPYSRKAIAVAEDAAREAGSALIDCDHLLLGLAALGRGVAVGVLDEAGVDTDALRA